MDKNIAALSPQNVWTYFSEMCAIPHPSFHEDAIREYLVGQGEAMGLETIVDEAKNVIIRKPATPGMESCKGVVLQAHMDMVPQKNNDKEFNFETDPIEAYIDGENVTADGTTLGADNAMGIAAALAVLASNELKHGDLEVLITATEESGMHGAFGFKGGVLRGDILLNLDTEREGELCVGCAGGLDLGAEFNYSTESVPADSVACTLAVKGLKGGHSGVEIDLERGNANKVLFRFLLERAEELSLRLSSIDCGGLRNAIPREGSVVMTLPAAKLSALQEAATAYDKLMKLELKGVDDGVSICVTETDMPDSVFDLKSQTSFIKAIVGCPNGVMRMSPSLKGLVQTSTNMARVVSEAGKINVYHLLRSSVSCEKYALAAMMQSVYELAGGSVTLSGGYDGWNPNPDSPILATMVAGYEALYAKKPDVIAIHAGLECGILGGEYPEMDMISFGPTIRFPHSPDECIEIASVAKFWDYLCYTLEHTPRK